MSPNTPEWQDVVSYFGMDESFQYDTQQVEHYTEQYRLCVQRDNLLFAIAHRFLREYDSEIHDGTMKELVGELHTIEDQIGDVK